MTREQFQDEQYYYNDSQEIVPIGGVIKRYVDGDTHYYKVIADPAAPRVFLEESGSVEPIEIEGDASHTIKGMNARDFFEECFPVPEGQQDTLGLHFTR